MMTVKRSGKLKYTKRGFQMDAEDAMQGDVVRALIELITNADDAYNAKGGVIEIRVKKTTGDYAHEISIHDKAGGLDGSRMESAFTDLGRENTKFIADQGTRGLFGRGAKDVAILGKAEFRSISKERLSTLEIFANSEYQMQEFDDKPKLEDYKSLMLSHGENGLTSKLYLNPVHKVPSPGDLIRKLQDHVQLRELLNRNSVRLTDDRNNSSVILKGLTPSGELVVDKEITIPKYSKKISLKVFKFKEKEQGQVNEYSAHGLVVSGRGAAYENSFLHYTSRPEAGWFCGTIDAPEIHDLAKTYDDIDGKTDLNPTRLVSRQRSGLIARHPYYRALCAAIEPELRPLFDEMAQVEGASRKEGAELRNRFDSIAETMAKTLQNLMDNDELGEIPTDSENDELGVELSIIPPARLVRLGESVTFTIRSQSDFLFESLSVSIDGDRNLVEVGSLDVNKWRKHSRLNAVDNNVTLKALKEGTLTLVVANSSTRATSKITIVNYEIPEIMVPIQLEFEREKYSVSPEKVKKLILRAPLDRSGEECGIESSEKLVEHKDRVRLRPHSSGLFSEAHLYVKAGKELGIAKVIAKLVDASTSADLEVREQGQRKIPSLKLELDGRDNPPRRVDTLREQGKLVIRIYGQHRSLKEVLGTYSENGFKSENSPQARASIAEIVSQQLAQYVVERESETYPERFGDAAKFFFRQQQLIASFIVAAQVGLIVQ
jgi:hypothetical protein